MPPPQALDPVIIAHLLATARITSRQQWDTLVFLSRHATSLVNADHIARLLGSATNEVVTALEDLEALGFVARSHVSQGVRLYQCTILPDTPQGNAWRQLLRLADSRAMRLLMSRRLWHDDRNSATTTQRAPALLSLTGGQAWRQVS